MDNNLTTDSTQHKQILRLNPIRMVFELAQQREEVISIIGAIMRYAPPDIIEVLGIFTMSLWSIFLLTPWAPRYFLVSSLHIIADLTWLFSIIGGYIALNGFYSLVTNFLLGRRYGAIIAALFWGFFLLVAVSSAAPPSVSVLFVVALCGSMWLYKRTSNLRSEKDAP